MDERQGGFQFNHCVQICSVVFVAPSVCLFGGFIESTRQWTVTTQRLLLLNHRQDQNPLQNWHNSKIFDAGLLIGICCLFDSPSQFLLVTARSRLASSFWHASKEKSSFSVKLPLWPAAAHKLDSGGPCMVALKTLHLNLKSAIAFQNRPSMCHAFQAAAIRVSLSKYLTFVFDHPPPPSPCRSVRSPALPPLKSSKLHLRFETPPAEAEARCIRGTAPIFFMARTLRAFLLRVVNLCAALQSGLRRLRPCPRMPKGQLRLPSPRAARSHSSGFNCFFPPALSRLAAFAGMLGGVSSPSSMPCLPMGLLHLPFPSRSTPPDLLPTSLLLACPPSPLGHAGSAPSRPSICPLQAGLAP